MSELNFTPELKASLAELLAQKTEGFKEHLTPEEIASCRAGKLAPQEEERLREHLSYCLKCVDLLLFDPELYLRESGVGDLEAERAWREMALRIRADLLRRKLRRQKRWTAMLAAVAAVFLLVPSLLFFRAEKTLHELASPQVNATIIDLAPARVRSLGEAAATQVEVGEDVRFFTLVIPVDPTDLEAYELRILSANGEQIYQTRDLEVDSYGTATLALSRHFLKAGEYLLEVSGSGARGSGEIWTHRIAVNYR